MERVAVVGLGNIATRHRRNLKQLFPNALLYAMSASGRMPQEAVSDADRLVESIDALIAQQVQLVIVASPAPFHAKHAIPLIKAGIAVLIEKPVSATLDEAKALQEVATQYQTPVAIGYCLRYLPSAVEIKKYLSSGMLGNLYHAHVEIGQYLPDWRPSKDYRESVSARSELGGGALLELSHELDYSQWLLGDLTLEHAILRSSKELSLKVEDSADMIFTTSQQAVLYVHLDFLQRRAYRCCRFVGSKGVLMWDLMKNELLFHSSQGDEVLYSDPRYDRNNMYLDMMIDFIDQVKGFSSKNVSVSDATKIIELIEQVKNVAASKTKDI
ncbi:Gfo/Idh/MocA family oxidoreductase [Vibrio cidicii]|nr:Gfo/Idh/MocA family oxidoreductase [Vibrio cidicii]